MSVARQPDLWPLLCRLALSSSEYNCDMSFPVAYVAGELDCKYECRKAPLPRQAVLPAEATPPSLKPDGNGGGERSMASASRSSSRSSSSVAEVVAATCPAVRVTILPDCGHAVPTEAPGPLYREVATLVAAAGRDVVRERTKP